MRFTEELISHLVNTIKGSLKVTFKTKPSILPRHIRVSLSAMLSSNTPKLTSILIMNPIYCALEIRHLKLEITGSLA